MMLLLLSTLASFCVFPASAGKKGRPQRGAARGPPDSPSVGRERSTGASSPAVAARPADSHPISGDVVTGDAGADHDPPGQGNVISPNGQKVHAILAARANAKASNSVLLGDRSWIPRLSASQAKRKGQRLAEAKARKEQDAEAKADEGSQDSFEATPRGESPETDPDVFADAEEERCRGSADCRDDARPPSPPPLHVDDDLGEKRRPAAPCFETDVLDGKRSKLWAAQEQARLLFNPPQQATTPAADVQSREWWQAVVGGRRRDAETLLGEVRGQLVDDLSHDSRFTQERLLSLHFLLSIAPGRGAKTRPDCHERLQALLESQAAIKRQHWLTKALGREGIKSLRSRRGTEDGTTSSTSSDGHGMSEEVDEVVPEEEKFLLSFPPTHKKLAQVFRRVHNIMLEKIRFFGSLLPKELNPNESKTSDGGGGGSSNPETPLARPLPPKTIIGKNGRPRRKEVSKVLDQVSKALDQRQVRFSEGIAGLSQWLDGGPRQWVQKVWDGLSDGVIDAVGFQAAVDVLALTIMELLDDEMELLVAVHTVDAVPSPRGRAGMGRGTGLAWRALEAERRWFEGEERFEKDATASLLWRAWVGSFFGGNELGECCQLRGKGSRGEFWRKEAIRVLVESPRANFAAVLADRERVAIMQIVAMWSRTHHPWKIDQPAIIQLPEPSNRRSAKCRNEFVQAFHRRALRRGLEKASSPSFVLARSARTRFDKRWLCC